MKVQEVRRGGFGAPMSDFRLAQLEMVVASLLEHALPPWERLDLRNNPAGGALLDAVQGLRDGLLPSAEALAQLPPVVADAFRAALGLLHPVLEPVYELWVELVLQSLDDLESWPDMRRHLTQATAAHLGRVAPAQRAAAEAWLASLGGLMGEIPAS